MPQPKRKKQWSTKPGLHKIIINCSIGEEMSNPNISKRLNNQIRLITGQISSMTRAKKAIANFKVRKGMPIGQKSTLRDEKMESFVQKLVHLVFPRVRDFQGLPSSSFDGCGNYSFGLPDQSVFAELESEYKASELNSTYGFTITLVTTAENDDDGLLILKNYGFPFA
jgi:large subunit ribosomal protein L5